MDCATHTLLAVACSKLGNLCTKLGNLCTATCANPQRRLLALKVGRRRQVRGKHKPEAAAAAEGRTMIVSRRWKGMYSLS